MKYLEVLRNKAREQNTKTLIDGLFLLEAKPALEEHERAVRACMCDVVEEREGGEFLDSLLDQLEAVAA